MHQLFVSLQQRYNVHKEYTNGTTRILQTSEPQTVVRDLQPGTSVSYQLAAIDEFGTEGDRSAEMTLTATSGESKLGAKCNHCIASICIVVISMHKHVPYYYSLTK